MILTPEQRWEQGIAHDPRSEKLARSVARIDYEIGGDLLGLKFGGDGDNGETLLYLLDCHYAEVDASLSEEQQAEDLWRVTVWSRAEVRSVIRAIKPKPVRVEHVRTILNHAVANNRSLVQAIEALS